MISIAGQISNSILPKNFHLFDGAPKSPSGVSYAAPSAVKTSSKIFASPLSANINNYSPSDV
jgi:hypothetical protein